MQVFEQVDENMRRRAGVFRRAVMIDERNVKITGDRVQTVIFDVRQ